MIDKSLVKQRFEKSLKTYDDNAHIQKLMAEKLIDFLPFDKFDTVLEIGCATGILTRKIKNAVKLKEFYANDIVENAEKYINKIIPENKFILGDIEEIKPEQKYDLIISNACLQWCNNIEYVISKLMNSLNQDGILAVSIFGDDNLLEIKKIFNIDTFPYSSENLKEYIKKYKVLVCEEEKNELYFDSPIEVLKHLKYTGANSLTKITLTKNKLQEIEEKYNHLYFRDGQVKLTYKPLYIILQN